MRFFKNVLFYTMSLKPAVCFMSPPPHPRIVAILKGHKSPICFSGLNSADNCFTCPFCCCDKTP